MAVRFTEEQLNILQVSSCAASCCPAVCDLDAEETEAIVSKPEKKRKHTGKKGEDVSSLPVNIISPLWSYHSTKEHGELDDPSWSGRNTKAYG